MLYNLSSKAIQHDGTVHGQSWDVDGKSTIVFVHADWCGYCKRTMPEFVKASGSIDKVRFALLSDVELKKMENPLQVTGFPSFFLLDESGKLSPSQFPREYEDMVKFIDNM